MKIYTSINTLQTDFDLSFKDFTWKHNYKYSINQLEKYIRFVLFCLKSILDLCNFTYFFSCIPFQLVKTF